jgi:hypothetical protein
MAIASLIIAIIAILIAMGSVAYTRRQTVASERLTAIEVLRRHEDLTPELDIRCTYFAGGDVTLELELIGPRALTASTRCACASGMTAPTGRRPDQETA